MESKEVLCAELKKELTILIYFAPITSDQKSVIKLLQYVQAELSKLNMRTSLIKHDGYNSMIAGTKSLTKSKLLLQAHVDVVPAPSSMFTTKIKGDKLFGRGTYDMLFSVAVYLVMLRNLNKNGKLHDLDIGIMLTGDEEIGGFNGVGKIIQNYKCNACLLPDAGRLDEISIQAKGVLELEIISKGSSGHAARPYEYDNPIIKLTKIINELARKFPNLSKNKTTCSITKLSAGEALNQVPDTASVSIDIRYIPKDNSNELQQIIKNIAIKYDGHVNQLVCEPSFNIDIKNKYIRLYRDVHQQVTGRKMTSMQSSGSSDARFLSSLGIPVIMTRPEGGGLHGPNEYVSLNSLAEHYTVVENYVHSIC